MRSFEEGLKTVSEQVSTDPLWKMKAYRLALFLGSLVWYDTAKLAADPRMVSLADQLFRAIGSVGANIAEGYSRHSGRDRARFYEYALGSARESRHWYCLGQPVLSENVVSHRIDLLAEISRLLVYIIPKERERNLAEEPVPYDTSLPPSINNAPLP